MTKQHPLASWRQKQGLTQSQAGALLDVTATTIHRWEAGEILPRKNTWPRIEKVTGLRPRQFLEYERAA